MFELKDANLFANQKAVADLFKSIIAALAAFLNRSTVLVFFITTLSILSSERLGIRIAFKNVSSMYFIFVS